MYYIMSDLHGCYDEFNAALSRWDKTTETLVVLGDLVDRGPDSLRVIRTLMALHTENPERVIVLKGNHDESFAVWGLEVPETDMDFYYMDMHEATVKSFYEGDTARYASHSKRARGSFIRHNFEAELRFLQSRPLVHETEHCIFVHAGINLKIMDWHTDRRCLNHIRNTFYASSRIAPKRVFFGHTTTENLHKDRSNRVWYSEHADKVGIDGGVVFGGQLNAVKVNERGCVTETIAIPSCKQPVR